MIASLYFLFLIYCNSYYVESFDCMAEMGFRCHNGKCVSKTLTCNGHDDCGDYSDEITCEIVKFKSETETKFECTDAEYACHDGKQCVPSKWACDGQPDCSDGSDEFANCHSANCTGFSCRKSKECIPSRWRCDGSHDCQDNSDEIGCFSSDSRCKKEDGRFECSDGLCIPASSVCNNVTECVEREDEGGLCGSAADKCKNKPCHHKCMDTPSGAQCYCVTGYRLKDDGLTCEDIDECVSLPGICSQKCTNTKGGYKCHCFEGYHLLADDSTCKVSGVQPILLISSPQAINSYNLQTKTEERVTSSDLSIEGMSFDGPIREIFWFEGDMKGSYIKSKQLGSGHVEKTLMHKGLQSIEAIDIDWLNQKIYIIESFRETITACEFDGSNCVAVVSSVGSSSLFLNPRKGMMYWSNYSGKRGIMQANMDGSEQVMLVTSEDSWPHGLYYDQYSDRLFWADIKHKSIVSYYFISKQKQDLVKMEKYHPYGIAVFEDRLYWSDLNLDAVLSCNKFTGRHIKSVHKDLDRPLNLIISHPILHQYDDANPCFRSLCSHACLIASNNTYTCKCPSGMILNLDNKTCTGENGTASLFVLNDGKKIVKIYEQAVGHDGLEEVDSDVYGNHIGAIQLHAASESFIYSDLQQDAIFSYNLHTHQHRRIIDSHVDTVKGIALDTYGDNIYWTDAAQGTIEVATLDGTFRKKLYDSITKPKDIVINPNQGIGFVVSGKSSSTIIKFDLTGDLPTEEVLTLLTPPKSLAIDLANDILLWIDQQKYDIESFNYKTNQRSQLSKHSAKPVSLVMAKEYFYWLDENDKLMSSSASHGLNDETAFIYRQDKNLKALLVASPPVDIQESRLCSCQQLCLQGSKGPLCSCAFGFTLDKNQTTCTAESKCNDKEFKCLLSNVCIPDKWKCDGNDDCMQIDPRDNSDEHNCFRCIDDEFTCASSGRCIHHSWKCDGVPDCSDKSDEDPKLCPEANISLDCRDMFSCGDQQCIDKAWVCDHDEDCANGADEDHCKMRMCQLDTQFECAPGMCISSMWRCDGFIDCLNAKDELNCSAAVSLSMPCMSNEFTCFDGHCIDSRLACDGRQDCADGSDENNESCGFNSVGQCIDGEYNCPQTNICLHSSQLCDDIVNCPDGQDEANCTTTTSSGESHCPAGHWRCTDSSACLLESAKCDGVINCKNGEDELFCPAKSKSSTKCNLKTEFACTADTCIPFKWVCDGQRDCLDGSDENSQLCHVNNANASSTAKTDSGPCLNGQFQCLSGECLEMHNLCDGHPDCKDYSDEGDRCNVCSRNNGGCSHTCTSSFHGPVCSCPSGLKLHDGLVCTDINECAEWGKCSQTCFNTRGSYKCSCQNGWTLEPDGRRCRPTNQSRPFILTSFKDQVRNISADGYHMRVVVQLNGSRVVDFIFDQQRRLLFYISSDKGNIRYMNLDEQTEPMEIKLESSATTLALDYITGNIYFSTINKTIDACDVFSIDSPMCITIVSALMDHIASLAIFAPDALMFWSTWPKNDVSFSNAQIWHSYLDGSEKRLIVSTKLVNPTSLTIDVTSRRLFWCDTTLNSIESTNLNGQDRITILRGVDLGNPLSVSVFGDVVYWLSGTFDLLMAADKFEKGGSTYSILKLDVRHGKCQLAHPYMQIAKPNACSWNSCSHICLRHAHSSSCFCPDGFIQLTSTLCIDPLIHEKNSTNTHAASVNNSVESSQAFVNSCENKICENGGKCYFEDNQALCSCAEGYSGDNCDVSSSGSGYDALGMGFGIGISFSIVLIAFLSYNNRQRIRNYVRRRRSRSLTILFQSSNSDTEQLNNLPKANNSKMAAARIAHNMSSKQLLSFHNPLSDSANNNEAETQWPHTDGTYYNSNEHLHVFETDDTANLIDNVQFHISPSSDSLTM